MKKLLVAAALAGMTFAATLSFAAAHHSGITRGAQVAETHTQICADNRDTCLKACDGATGCSKQCWTNYNGCIKE